MRIGRSSLSPGRPGEVPLSRRTVLHLSALAAGGHLLTSSAGGTSATERWVSAPRWTGFRSIRPTAEGYLLTGLRTSAADEQVGWAVALDDDLEVAWSHTYQSAEHLAETDRGEDHDGLEFALPADDGGFLLVGWWHMLGSDSRYGWLTRVGPDGIPWWSRTYNRDGVNSFRDDFAGGVATDETYLLVGRTIADEYADETTGDGWIVSVERGRPGRVRWQRAYDPSGTSTGWHDDTHHAEFTAAAPTDDGFLVVGEASPNGPTASTDTAAWALRIDEDGDERWSRTYRFGGGTRTQFGDVAAADEGFYVAGVSGQESLVRELHDYQLSGRSWAAKLDSDGRVVWQDAPGGDGFRAVEATAEGAVFVGSNDGRGWAVAYDADGDRLGAVRSPTADSTYADVTTVPGGYLCVGAGGHGSSTDGLLARLDRDDLEDGGTSEDGGGRSDDADRGSDDRGGGDGDAGDGDAGDAADRREHLLEIVARETGDVRYAFTVDGSVSKARLTDRVKAESNDALVENGDGTVSVEGFTGNEGYGDAYRYTGTVRSFERTGGDAAFDLRLDGQRISVDQLVGG